MKDFFRDNLGIKRDSAKISTFFNFYFKTFSQKISCSIDELCF